MRLDRILIAEDNLADVVLVRRAFQQQLPEAQVIAVDSLTAARQALDRDQPSLMIVDFMLPDGNGTDLIAAGLARNCPTIVLTGRGNEATAVQAIQRGALDYVVKSEEQIAQLPRIAQRALREWELTVERERNSRLLEESEERFRTFAELAANWFWETDDALRMTFFSEGFGYLVGQLDAGEPLGTALREVLLTIDAGLDLRAVEPLWQRRQEFELTFSCRSPHGGAQTFYLRGIPFFTDRQEFRGYRGIGRGLQR